MSNFVSDKRKIIFLHLPKTGGRTITKILAKKEDFKRVKGKKISVNSLCRNLLTSDKKLTKKKLRNYFTFAVVRNPYHRFVSAYNWFFNTMSKEDVYKGREISFQRALDKNICLDKYPGFYAHAHVPYTQHLLNLDFYNQILRLEYFRAEITEVLEANDIEFDKLEHTHISNKKDMRYWTKSREQILYEQLKPDFEIFNYPRMSL